MNKRIKRIIILGGTIFALLLGANFVLALEVHYPNIMGLSINDTSNLSSYACYLYGIITNLAIFVAVIMVAAGGIYYLVDYGRGKFTNEAKDVIKAGIAGLIITVCAVLIANTINPNMTSCKLGVLSVINIPINNNTTTSSTSANVKTYQEIPIGTLTETLLTKTMDCYGFDQEGNPIAGDDIKTDSGSVPGPTYMDHDRADCLLQLADGAQKKAQVAAELSDAIINLMKTCSCEKYGKCDDTCGGAAGCQVTGDCPNGHCTGKCIGAACARPNEPPDCCPLVALDSNGDPMKNKDGTPVSLTVKEQIEHGPVGVGGDDNSSNNNCDIPINTYRGLDEFRCPSGQPCSGIVSFVETQVKTDDGKTITIIKQDKWDQLSLLQQLTYFKEKIDEVKRTIQDDEDELDKARSAVANCYLATAGIDLLKAYKNTDQNQTILLTSDGFSDPETGKQTDPSTYCAGFNYSNSGCFKKCNDLCPDTSGAAVSAYADCKSCPGNDPKCLQDQEDCITKAYNNRPCTQTSDKDAPKTFGDCVGSCQNSCSDDCAKRYAPCSQEYDFCKSQCDNNSNCILTDQSNVCLFGAQGFINCASPNTVTDQGNINYCINNAYLCKNGSDQYAGYPDCTNSSVYGSSQNKYSASDLHSNPDSQKCKNPNSPAKTGSSCYSAKSPNASCQSVCPETSKCPAASNCGQCLCDQISNPTDPTKPLTIEFSVPNESVPSSSVDTGNAGKEGYYTQSENVSAYQMVGPQCNSYSASDDPLTFYCEDNWWKDPDTEGTSTTPIGTQRMCSQQGDVPVGQTVDDAKTWANKLIDDAGSMSGHIQDIITKITKAGDPPSEVKNYCKCDAKFEGGSPICKTNCDYKSWYDENGDCQQDCIFVPCTGSPCDQLINYLSSVWNSYRDLKIGFIDFDIKMIKEPRSDIMKELTYSRKQTDTCSTLGNIYGSGPRLLSCSRVEDELIPPINPGAINFRSQNISDYCYGIRLNESLTDNWYCCQNWQQNTTPGSDTTGTSSLIPAPDPDCLDKNNGDAGLNKCPLK